MRRRYKALVGTLVFGATFSGGCRSQPIDPLPAARDSRLVGNWLQTKGIQGDPDATLRIRLRADGTGDTNMSLESEGKVRVHELKWGTSGNSLVIARPSVDTGPLYESALYALDPEAKVMSVKNSKSFVVIDNQFRELTTHVILNGDLKRE
jgi:hypothetical protein